jgi:flagellar hook-length control protein FliK
MMRTEKVEGPQEPNNNKKHRHDGARPKRTGEKGPLGFGSVMRDVRGGEGGTKDGAKDGGAGTATTSVGQAGFDPAMLQALQADAGANAAQAMGRVEGAIEQLNDDSFGVQDASDALVQQDRSVTHQAQVQPHVPTPLGRMTPAALIETVLDEATKLEIERASRDLHVELEPADLGPLLVKLRRKPDGALDIHFLARQGDAARLLESGSELLRGRLADAGFANVAIDVRHDSELRLTGG